MKQHIVDLLALHGRGWCNCPDWQIRRRRRRENCKHIDRLHAMLGANLRKLQPGGLEAFTNPEIGKAACKQRAKELKEGTEETDC